MFYSSHKCHRTAECFAYTCSAPTGGSDRYVHMKHTNIDNTRLGAILAALPKQRDRQGSTNGTSLPSLPPGVVFTDNKQFNTKHHDRR